MTKKQLQVLLIKQRERLNLSQQEVADLSDVSRQFYSMVEKGERKPSVPVAKKIADALEIEWTIFFEVTSNPKLLEGNAC
ncbi:helix-turn-helix transcriptional regulator [Jeotgalibacillus proteolyticus]|uniref:XRE family transcriptional regulator n=1 Tax=Jeotgalibacillus proteolyticus TaxID=2082395 RepID=A0A2S5GAP6_9BACL|nr:helix-turn-helix transcriptional regulator [Jeotgalibacillus proteolyticus]PPA70079.1 XRE family transcriptional regulator [Jeotgalibacillus proteolyticus]